MVLLHLRTTGGALRHRNPVLIECYEFSIPGRLWRLSEKARGRWRIAKRKKEGNRERMFYCFEPAELLEALGWQGIPD